MTTPSLDALHEAWCRSSGREIGLQIEQFLASGGTGPQLANALSSWSTGRTTAAADPIAWPLPGVLRFAAEVGDEAALGAWVTVAWASAEALADREPNVAIALARPANDLESLVFLVRAAQPQWAKGHEDRLEAMRPRIADWTRRERPELAKAFAEPRFRAHLTDSAAAGAGLRATCQALEAGVPQGLLCESVLLAAAERVLRFDVEVDADPDVAEGWPEVSRLLELAAAVHRMRGRMPAERWTEFLLLGADLVHSSAVLDAATADRPPWPEPEPLTATWDHGPEIARLLKYLSAGQTLRATGLLRGYLAAGLPEQPLVRELVRSVAVLPAAGAADRCQMLGCVLAAWDGHRALAGHPQQDLLLGAALRVMTARRACLDPPLVAMIARQVRTGGNVPRERIVTGSR
ncbi:MAG: hypothetical protein ACOYOB_04995 [Myxococcota bacterium]